MLTTRTAFITLAILTALVWLLAAIGFGAVLQWAFDAQASGPGCPNMDPSWLGFCSAGAP